MSEPMSAPARLDPQAVLLPRILDLWSGIESRPTWRPVEFANASYFREDAFRKNAAGSLNPDRAVRDLRRHAFERLHAEGLAAACAHAAVWLRDGPLAHTPLLSESSCEAALSVSARSATRSYTLDAVLYVDGIAPPS